MSGFPGGGGASGAVSSVFTRTGAVVAASGDYTAAQVANAADKSSGSAQVFSAEVEGPTLGTTGITGITGGRFLGVCAAGGPASGTFAAGDWCVDGNGVGWVCTTPGTIGSGCVFTAETGSAVTLTNKRITKRVGNANAPGATPSMNTDNYDVFSFTGLGTAITSMTTNLTGSPVAGDTVVIELTDNGTGRGITWGASFASTTITLPTTTVASTLLTVGLRCSYANAAWLCVAVA